MTPALFGLVTAFCWGGADFIARFTGRALGHQLALMGMLGFGAIMMTAVALILGTEFRWHWGDAWLLVSAGIGIMVATLLLYWGLARGPISIVSPIVGSYPALNVGFEVALGARPTWLDWACMAAVLLGVVIVARAARHFEGEEDYSREELRKTIVISLGSSLAFALAIGTAQHAAAAYGELQTLVLGRWISFAAIALVLLAIRLPIRATLSGQSRWLPWILLQALLDSSGYAALLAAGTGAAGAIAVVISSGFGAVTVLLARLILREAMTIAQWGGIALIVAGVAVLSGP